MAVNINEFTKRDALVIHDGRVISESKPRDESVALPGHSRLRFNNSSRLSRSRNRAKVAARCGGIAQLVERVVRNENGLFLLTCSHLVRSGFT